MTMYVDVQPSIRILSIDPGTYYTGVAIMDLNHLGEINIRFVETIDSGHLSLNMGDVVYVHGDRFARILAITHQITNIINQYQPNVVVSESPYMGRFPAAYGALVEVLSMIRLTIYHHNPSMGFLTIEPSAVKQAFNVKGTSGDKNLMYLSLLKLNLVFDTYLHQRKFDEHSIDAIAVGYAHCKRLNEY